MATGEPDLETRPLLFIFNSQLGLGCTMQTNKFEVLKRLFIFWHCDKISIYQSAKHINLLLWTFNGLNNPSIKKKTPTSPWGEIPEWKAGQHLPGTLTASIQSSQSKQTS